MSTSGPEVVKELFKAVKGGDISKVRELLSQGINPNERNSSDETALMAAAEKGNLEIFDLLQQAGGDLGARAKNGSTVLFRAARCLHGNESAGLEMLQGVITAVGIGANQEAFNRVLVLCSADRSPDYLRALVRFGADPNYRRENGEYALLSAVWQNRPEVVSVLLAAGADPNATVPRGKTLSWMENIPRRYWGRPLADLAIGKRLRQIVELLSKAGATPTPPSAVEEITTSWEGIDRWLQMHAPQWSPLYPGATERQIAETQAILNVTFPPDLHTCYEIHNGSESFFPAVDTSRYLMPLSEVVAHWKMLGENLDRNEFAGIEVIADIGIAPVFWHKGWIPFISNGGGDYFCLDLAPGEEGVIGQIVSFNHETGERWLVAPSLRTWLWDLVQELQAGRLRYEEGEGLVSPSK